MALDNRTVALGNTVSGSVPQAREFQGSGSSMSVPGRASVHAADHAPHWGNTFADRHAHRACATHWCRMLEHVSREEGHAWAS